jgi:endonuclease V-like protein UPF0215 family
MSGVMSKYNLANQDELDKAFAYLQQLIERDAEVEIKRVVHKRSLNQNNYLYLLLGIFGLETGFNEIESKSLYKREANPKIYVYDKNGTKFLRSTADLNTKEMSESIDKFIKYAGEQGIELPRANEKEALRYWNNEIEKKGNWL